MASRQTAGGCVAEKRRIPRASCTNPLWRGAPSFSEKQTRDAVAANDRKRLADRGIPIGKHGVDAVIQCANSDLRCSPHVHGDLLDGV
jgi:hypothetical protein